MAWPKVRSAELARTASTEALVPFSSAKEVEDQEACGPWLVGEEWEMV